MKQNHTTKNFSTFLSTRSKAKGKALPAVFSPNNEDHLDRKNNHDKRSKIESSSWLNYRWLLAAVVVIFSSIVLLVATCKTIKVPVALVCRKNSLVSGLLFALVCWEAYTYHTVISHIGILLPDIVPTKPNILVPPLTITDLVVDRQVTWTAADNPISVSGKVEIVTNGILTLQEGVQVWFESSLSGIVNSGGTLLILGQPWAHVVLRPRSMNGTWQGISFGPLAVSALFEPDLDTIVKYQGGSIIEYTDIFRAGTQYLAALDFDYGAAPYLSDVNLAECRGRGSPQNAAIWISRLVGYFVADHVKLSKETGGLWARGVPAGQYMYHECMTSPKISTWLTNLDLKGFLLVRHFEADHTTPSSLRADALQSVTVLDSLVRFMSVYLCNSVSIANNSVVYTRAAIREMHGINVECSKDVVVAGNDIQFGRVGVSNYGWYLPKYP